MHPHSYVTAASKKTGHASIEQTLKTDTHLLKKTDDQMMEKTEELHGVTTDEKHKS